MDEILAFQPITLVVLITILAFYESTFTGVHLILKKSVRSKANRYLGGILLIATTVLIPIFLYEIGLLEEFPHFVHMQFVTYFLLGPLAYFYVRACTQKGFKVKPILWLHFIPFVMGIIYLLPFYLQSGEEKYQAFIIWIGTGFMDVPNWVMFIRMIHPIIYLFICLQLVFLYKKHLDNTTSFIDLAFHRWLLYFLGILLLPIIGVIFKIATSLFLEYQLNVPTIIFGLVFLFAASIRVAQHLKPSLFHVFPHQVLIPNSTEDKKQRYEKSTLQETLKEQFVKKLLNFMDSNTPYLASDLTLAELSKQVKIPVHHLSQIINEKLGCNFLDFINQYRVKAAQKMLLDPKLNHYTVVSIAYEAGFNSKSTFYAAFKKYTSMTPSRYKKQALKKTPV